MSGSPKTTARPSFPRLDYSAARFVCRRPGEAGIRLLLARQERWIPAVAGTTSATIAPQRDNGAGALYMGRGAPSRVSIPWVRNVNGDKRCPK
jgi:hypothetical protein